MPVLANDFDVDDDRLQFVKVAGQVIDTTDGLADKLRVQGGVLEVFNPGDDADNPDSAYLKFTALANTRKHFQFRYTIEDIAPLKVKNNTTTEQLEVTHTPRRASAKVKLIVSH